LCVLTLGDLLGSHVVERSGGDDARSKFEEKSDHLVVAWKPVKVGGAKGVMGREKWNLAN
jgi:hypothetical protein